MSMPFYVAPEQFMKDKADFARKNIARGRPLVATVYAEGILICAENPSRSLHKVSEIYDRIAFAGVGRYNEFDQLRRVRGPARRRQGLPVQPGGRRRPLPGQPLRPVHGQRLHPRDEAPRGRDPRRRGRDDPGEDQLFHILYDGSVVDEERFTVLGGEAEAIASRMESGFSAGWDLAAALRTAATAALRSRPDPGGRGPRGGRADRGNGRRAFRRLDDAEISALLEAAGAAIEQAEPGQDAVGGPDAAATEEPGSSPGGGASGGAESRHRRLRHRRPGRT